MADCESTEISGKMEIGRLKVDELKHALSTRGLKTKGNKDELRQRLADYLKEHSEEFAGEDELVDDPDDEDIEEVDEAHVEEEDDDHAESDTDHVLDAVKDLDESREETVPRNDTDTLVPTKEVSDLSTKVKSLQSDPEEKEGTAEDITGKGKPSGIKAPLSDKEKITNRLKRFGPQSSEAKIQAREARFLTSSTGVVSQGSKVVTADEAEKIKRRAERFGAVSPMALKMDESERIKRRKERFGAVSSTRIESSNGESEAKKKKRAERFGL